MKTKRIDIPKPPSRSSRIHSLIQEGTEVSYIWFFNEAGRRSIETLYDTAKSLQATYGLSRSTAYRLINKQRKRYWIIDYTDPDEPACMFGVPVEVGRSYTPLKAGNPNFTNGIYQQSIAHRRARHHHRG